MKFTDLTVVIKRISLFSVTQFSIRCYNKVMCYVKCMSLRHSLFEEFSLVWPIIIIIVSQFRCYFRKVGASVGVFSLIFYILLRCIFRENQIGPKVLIHRSVHCIVKECTALYSNKILDKIPFTKRKPFKTFLDTHCFKMVVCRQLDYQPTADLFHCSYGSCPQCFEAL